jgi:hypothetical protein
MMLEVEYTATRVIDVELVNDESGGRLLKCEFTTFKRVGNTIQLRAERQPNQFPAQSEQWTLQRLLRNVYIFGRIGDVTGLSTV